MRLGRVQRELDSLKSKRTVSPSLIEVGEGGVVPRSPMNSRRAAIQRKAGVKTAASVFSTDAV